MDSYTEFLATKRILAPAHGQMKIEVIEDLMLGGHGLSPAHDAYLRSVGTPNITTDTAPGPAPVIFGSDQTPAQPLSAISVEPSNSSGRLRPITLRSTKQNSILLASI